MEQGRMREDTSRTLRRAALRPCTPWTYATHVLRRDTSLTLTGP